MLVINNISKSYRGQKAVSEISLSVDKGQILGIIGANGAGKSTLVSMLATLSRPDSGEIIYDGSNIVSSPQAIRSKMGFVPQDIALYESLTGLDNLRFWGKNYKVPKTELKDRIEQVCAIIGFTPNMLKKRVSEYSGGMKRRLNLGVALLHNPELVILDEPTAGVDIQSAKRIAEAMVSLKEKGTAVIYVGHYMEELEQIATHICIMDSGRAVAYGTIDELLKTPEGKISLSELYSRLCTA